MSNREARGAKRKCQNEECESSFYDLNRDEFDCPVCGSVFDHEAHELMLAKKRDEVPDYIRRRQARDLPILAAPEAPDENANDNKPLADGQEQDDAAGDGEAVAEDETATEAAADVLLEDDEDDEQDPLADAVPLSAADDEEQ